MEASAFLLPHLPALSALSPFRRPVVRADADGRAVPAILAHGRASVLVMAAG